MPQNVSYSKCAYLDTSILSETAKHPEWYRPLFNILFNNRLYIALSDSLLVELSQTTKKHSELDNLFTLLPSGKIKNFETVIAEEVISYPKKRNESLLSYPLTLEVDKQTIPDWLVSNEVKKAKRQQLVFAKNMKQQLDSAKSNLPHSKKNKYSIKQAEIFTWMVIIQWLTANHPTFMKKLNDKGLLLRAEAFPSVQLYTLYIYYKHYLGNRESKELSELSNLLHLFHFPYCKLIIVEREMYNILHKIKSQYKLLQDTEIKNIDFFKDPKFAKG